MNLHRSAPYLLASLAFPLLPAAAQSTITDHYTMHVDSVRSQVQYVIDTTLGPCTLLRGSNSSKPAT